MVHYDENSLSSLLRHVRCLVSERTRPRLPWAIRLPSFQKDPKPVLELLEILKNDPELYVRRSVANTLHEVQWQNCPKVFKLAQKL